MTPVKSKETSHALFPLQLGYVHVQVHPVDPFHFQGHVFVQHFGNAAWYAHFGSG